MILDLEHLEVVEELALTVNIFAESPRRDPGCHRLRHALGHAHGDDRRTTFADSACVTGYMIRLEWRLHPRTSDGPRLMPRAVWFH